MRAAHLFSLAAAAVVIAAVSTATGHIGLLSRSMIFDVLTLAATLKSVNEADRNHRADLVLRAGLAPLKGKELDALAGQFKALSDSTRLSIVNSLANREECCVCEFQHLGSPSPRSRTT